jgi:hypothetical protein
MSRPNFQQENVLELMQAHASSLHDTSQILDAKAQQNINVSSIILALVSIFNIDNINSETLQNTNEYYLFLLILVIYIFIFVLSYVVKSPKLFATHPMDPTWDKVWNEWLELDFDEYYKKLIASYIDIIEDNTKIVAQKGRLVEFATILVGLDIVLVVLLIVS